MSYGKKRVQAETYAYRILSETEVTVTTAGTPVACPSNTEAVAVRVINNTANIVAVGLIASVDALSTPAIGVVLLQYDTMLVHVRSNANEIAVDASVNGTKVTIQILGV